MKTVVKGKRTVKTGRKGRKASVVKKVPVVESCQAKCDTTCDTKQQLSDCQQANQALERAQGILVAAVHDQGHKVQSLSNDFQLAKSVIGTAGRSAAELNSFLLNYIEVATGLDQAALDNISISGSVPTGIPSIDSATFLRAMARLSSELESLAGIQELGT